MRKRPSSTAIGRVGEEVAVAYLMERGYQILARNVRFRFGEIDMVAEEGGVVIFVEVKTRSGPAFGSAAEAITARKRHQLVRLAAYYLASRGWDGRPCRFDVVAVESGPEGGWLCTLIRDAFSAT